MKTLFTLDENWLFDIILKALDVIQIDQGHTSNRNADHCHIHGCEGCKIATRPRKVQQVYYKKSKDQDLPENYPRRSPNILDSLSDISLFVETVFQPKGQNSYIHVLQSPIRPRIDLRSTPHKICKSAELCRPNWQITTAMHSSFYISIPLFMTCHILPISANTPRFVAILLVSSHHLAAPNPKPLLV